MENSDLHGTLVLVRPDLENDPVRQQGQVGVLTYIDSSDNVYVSFPNRIEGKYDPDALMQLKEKEEIFPQLKDYDALNMEDYKDLYKISLLQDMGRSTDILRALEIAGNNPALWDKALVNVEDKMAWKQVFSVSR
jgi:hypothetical protein